MSDIITKSNIANNIFIFFLILNSVLYLLRDKKEIKLRIIFLVFSFLLAPFFSHLLYSLLRFGHAFHDKGIKYALLPFHGGFTVYGAFLGIIISAYIVSIIFKSKLLDILNKSFPYILMILAVSRMCEGLWFMGYGRFIEESAFEFFPLAIYDSEYESWLYAIFAYEALFAFLASQIMFHIKNNTFIKSICIYAAAQIVFESMRQDEILRWGFVLCNQVFSGLIILSCLIYALIKKKAKIKEYLFNICVLLLCVGVVITMEFALESRVPFIESFTRLHCYLCDISAVSVMYILVILNLKNKAIK